MQDHVVVDSLWILGLRFSAFLGILGLSLTYLTQAVKLCLLSARGLDFSEL